MFIETYHQTVTPIRSGKEGVADTVYIMLDQLREAKTDLNIRHLAMQLVSHVRSHSHDDEVRAVFNYVRDSIRYLKDINDLETVASPRYTLDVGQGDCDDQSLLLAAMLQSIGIQTLFVTASYREDKQDEHIYVWARTDTADYHLDPTIKEFQVGDECEGFTSRTYWG